MSKTRAWKKRTPAQQAADNERARKRRALKAKAADRPARVRHAARKVRPARTVAAKRAGGQAGARTAYSLVDGIPETPKAGSTGRQILDAIKHAGSATIPELIQATKAPPATVRKWVHMLRTVKAVKSVPAEAHA